MDKTFHIPHCAEAFSQREALLLTQRLVQLALTQRQIGESIKLLNKSDSSYNEVKTLLEGSIKLLSEQMTIQLLQFSNHWKHFDPEK